MSDRRKGYRERTREKPEQGDAIGMTLTVQVLICLVIILAATILKRTDRVVYNEIKAQFSVMVSDSGQNNLALEYLSDWQGSFRKVIDGIAGWFARQNGAAGEAPEEGLQESEPQSDREIPEQAYNYLVPGGTSGGQGGWFPVEFGQDDGTGLLPPEGCSLAPVALTAVMKPPVTGIITSPYCYRYHPISGTTDFHTGVDIAAVEGTDILAALPGTVEEAGQSSIYGNYVIIRHSDTLSTFYAHCLEVLVEKDMVMRQGERIALVGSTGVSTGPHLHFSVLVGGVYTDPVYSLERNIRIAI